MTRYQVSIVESLAESLSSLDNKTNESIKNIQDELNKLKESISNLDNTELKNVLDSMEDLKKMADQIEDLRKLNDLKDLADNVDSLKDLKSELDRLSKEMKGNDESKNEFSKMLEDLVNKQKELNEGFIGLKNDLAKEHAESEKKDSSQNDQMAEDVKESPQQNGIDDVSISIACRIISIY